MIHLVSFLVCHEHSQQRYARRGNSVPNSRSVTKYSRGSERIVRYDLTVSLVLFSYCLKGRYNIPYLRPYMRLYVSTVC